MKAIVCNELVGISPRKNEFEKHFAKETTYEAWSLIIFCEESDNLGDEQDMMKFVQKIDNGALASERVFFSEDKNIM